MVRCSARPMRCSPPAALRQLRSRRWREPSSITWCVSPATAKRPNNRRHWRRYRRPASGWWGSLWRRGCWCRARALMAIRWRSPTKHCCAPGPSWSAGSTRAARRCCNGCGCGAWVKTSAPKHLSASAGRLWRNWRPWRPVAALRLRRWSRRVRSPWRNCWPPRQPLRPTARTRPWCWR